MTSDSEPTERYASHPAFSPRETPEQQHIRLEIMQSEIEWLQGQVQTLQQTLLYQAQQQHKNNREI